MPRQTKVKAAGVQVEHVPVGDLVAYARNSRTHTPKQIAQIASSIEEFGFLNPVLITADNDIIAGHGRVLAAKQLDRETVPCIRVEHLTEAQRRAYVIADNKLAMNSDWNTDLLAGELAALRGDLDLTLLGFSEDELDEYSEMLDGAERDREEEARQMLPQAIQLEPAREYAVIMCADEAEWEALKVALKLTPVRRGGYKQGSPFDAVGTQRVVKAADVLRLLK